MTNRSIALLSIALMTALLAGCASNPAANDATASIPPPIATDTPITGRSPLSGTWYGSAYEVGAGASQYTADESLRSNDDGTCTLTERSNGRAAVEYSGTATVDGNRVILSAANGRRWISLTRKGRRLYGLAYVNSRLVMLEFTRAEQ